MQARGGVSGLSINSPFFENQNKFLRKSKIFAKNDIFHNKKKRNFNKQIGKHTSELRSVDGSPIIVFILDWPKIRSLSR